MSGMVRVERVITGDGSDTLFNPEVNQHYHSTFGAIGESLHIYINAGLLFTIDKLFPDKKRRDAPLRVFEIGFGTGLNTLLTRIEAERSGIPVDYTTLEAFPLPTDSWQALNYPTLLGSAKHAHIFSEIHDAEWNKSVPVSPFFSLQKLHTTLETYSPPENWFDLVYFDAFGPDAQPELWQEDIFRSIYNSIVPGGTFVTYSVKGTVVRAMRAAGFRTEKREGPPGKRHILRAYKS